MRKIQPSKKLVGPFIQTPEKEPEQEYRQSELDTIFESDSKDFLKDDILRIICATVCKTDYTIYFQIFVKINEHDIRIIIDSGVTENSILFKAVKKFKIYKQRKTSLIEFMIINSNSIFQNDEFIKFETLLLFIII